MGVFSIVATVACTPQFDWRNQRGRENGQSYALQMPGKAVDVQKTVELAGQKVQLTLEGVQIDGMQFAFGHVAAQSAQQAQDLSNALAQSFVNNLKTKAPAFKPVELAKALGAQDFQDLGADRHAYGRFIWTDKAAYQLLVIGDAKRLPPEVADQFLRSMQFE